MSRLKRRRLLTLAAGATVIAATVALPTHTLSAVTAGVFNMSSTAVTAPGTGGNDNAPITKVPANKPATGEIYDGLKPAKAKTACAGTYHVADSGQCSHGPDKPPQGLNVKKDVAPVAPAIKAEPVASATVPAEADVAKDIGAVPPADADSPAFVAQTAPGTAAAVGANGVVCEGDGKAGKRVQVLYARDAGTPDRFGQYAESFRTWAVGADAIYAASAAETGGVRHIRFVTTPDCKVDVVPVELPAGSMADFGTTLNALKALGYNATNRIYMIFGDAKVYCGIGSLKGDERAGAANRSNTGPGYGRSDSGCWSSSVISHEFGHNLGAVNNSAPNSSKAGHCVDEYDIMCYADAPGTTMKIVCSDRKHDNILDCNHDDYFNTNPAAGSYLATHWNTADNDFLIKSDGTGTPPPPPTPAPSPTISPTVPPKPTPTGSPSPVPSPVPPSPTTSPTGNPPPPNPTPTTTPKPAGDLKQLTVVETTSNSVTLTWPAAAANGTRYGLTVNNRQLGVLGGTAVKLIGLRPGASYAIQVTVNRKPYTETVTVRAAAAAPAPAAGQWSVLTNAFTGHAVDLFGGRSASNTPAVAWPANGYANQQWQPVPAAAGTVLFKSRASNKCLSAAGGKTVAGSGIVQADCDPADAAQQWKVVASKYGVTLTTAKGDLVIGVGTASQGCGKPLVLQRPTGARYQSWAVAAAKR